MRYSENTSTELTLATAAIAADVFQVYNAGVAPDFRETLTGVTGTTLTIPNSETYTVGNEKLLVFRNGLLMYNSLVLGEAVSRYQEDSATQIELEETAALTDVFEFVNIT
jgi:hypothetical protein